MVQMKPTKFIIEIKSLDAVLDEAWLQILPIVFGVEVILSFDIFVGLINCC